MYRKAKWFIFAIPLIPLLITLACVHTRKGPADLEALHQQFHELYAQKCYLEAIPIAENMLSINEKSLGPDHPDVAESLNSLASIHRSLGDYAKVEPLYKRCLEIRMKTLGPDHPDVAIVLQTRRS